MNRVILIKKLIKQRNYIDVVSVVLLLVLTKEKDGDIYSKINKLNPINMIFVLIGFLIKMVLNIKTTIKDFVKNELNSKHFEYSKDLYLTGVYKDLSENDLYNSQLEEIHKRFK